MKIIFPLLVFSFADSVSGEDCRDINDVPGNGLQARVSYSPVHVYSYNQTMRDAPECGGADCSRDWQCIDGQCRCGYGFPTEFIGYTTQPNIDTVTSSKLHSRLVVLVMLKMQRWLQRIVLFILPKW